MRGTSARHQCGEPVLGASADHRRGLGRRQGAIARARNPCDAAVVTRVRLDLALVARGLAHSRSDARAAICAGLVEVNGAPAHKPALLVGDGDAIAARPIHPWVGRGGVKLAAALDAFAIDPAGLVCLDVGASTGGFTQVLRARGARRVYAVDVGRGQMHQSVADDPCVVVREGLDARALTRSDVPEPVDIITADVSFISLAKALPAALACAGPTARLVALVKPQFELGPGAVGKGGIVRDGARAESAVERVAEALARLGWRVCARMDSPIAGGSGNREFLVLAVRSA